MRNIAKRISSLALALVLMLGMTVSADAASKVTYEGDAKAFIFETDSTHHPKDLFTDMKGVMPGDTIVQEIEISNNSPENTTAEIFIKADGSEKESPFLSQMQLTVKGADDQDVFTEPDETADDITEWNSLGIFERGGSTVLTVTLNVPITMGNDFQDQLDTIDWKFKVEEFDTGSGDIDDDNKPGVDPDDNNGGGSGNADGDSGNGAGNGHMDKGDGSILDNAEEMIDDMIDGIRTGDNGEAGLFAALGAGSLALIIYLVVRGKRRENK